MDKPPQGDEGSPQPQIDDFLEEPTRRLADWRWLWAGDHPFPIRSHRGFWGRFLVWWKRLLRPLVKIPLNDLWDRQRVFNLILLEHLQGLEELHQEARLRRLEEDLPVVVRDVMLHNDALFSRVDQKLDRYRREVRETLAALGSALAAVESQPEKAPSTVLSQVRADEGYVELERRFRGTEEEIRERVAGYLPYLEGRGEVLDLGCGRGEALALLRERGVPGRGVDNNVRMVAHCREQGLEVEEGDLLEYLAAQPEARFGAVVSFHVVEHLPVEAVDRLVRLAWRALRQGGVLVLETPNPLSLVVAARNFWLDPTHRRPLHPESLKFLCELAGFEEIELLQLHPFDPESRLPELVAADVPEHLQRLVYQINRLRDRLDDLLFGYQDYAVVAFKR